MELRFLQDPIFKGFVGKKSAENVTFGFMLANSDRLIETHIGESKRGGEGPSTPKFLRILCIKFENVQWFLLCGPPGKKILAP